MRRKPVRSFSERGAHRMQDDGGGGLPPALKHRRRLPRERGTPTRRAVGFRPGSASPDRIRTVGWAGGRGEAAGLRREAYRMGRDRRFREKRHAPRPGPGAPPERGMDRKPAATHGLGHDEPFGLGQWLRQGPRGLFGGEASSTRGSLADAGRQHRRMALAGKNQRSASSRYRRVLSDGLAAGGMSLWYSSRRMGAKSS